MTRKGWRRGLQEPGQLARDRIDLAALSRLEARFMDDWERLPHGQSNIRITRG